MSTYISDTLLMKSVYSLTILFLTLLLPLSSALAIDKPELMLAKVYQPSVEVPEYWISEKLDGVRAHWNGQQLISRGGTLLIAPEWFIEGFPDIPLDGELWIARGAYQKTVSVIKKQKAHSGWNKVKFMLFDLPTHPGPFSDRLTAMRNINKRIHSTYLKIIPQYQLSSNKELMQRLKTVTAQGGEGLMLHHKSGLYHSGRSSDLLKLKLFTDAEAVVIDYRAGKGRNTGKMGAIKVSTKTGKVFYIGSGFSRQEREKPPAIGSTITFRHQGVTDSGIPRFAVFIRVRDEP